MEKLDDRVCGTDGRAWGDAWEEVQQYIRKVGPVNYSRLTPDGV